MLAFLWILFRVITKPSRLTYPCVRVAMPLASSFLGWVAMIVLSIFTWIQLKKQQIKIVTFGAVAFGMAGMGGSLLLKNYDVSDTPQFASAVVAANQPIGTAVGIYPGRVVWVHNPNATNENCTPDAVGNAWFSSANYSQSAVDSMLSSAIRRLTGQTSDSAAWRAIFQFHNSTRGKGAVNYVPGQKIFIKINATSAWYGNYNNTDLSKVANSNYGISETSPAVVLAVLRQLVNVVGVAQSDIYVGDPMKHIYKHLYDLWHGAFPNVVYLDYDHTTYGRTKVVASTTAKIFYSDRGSVLRANGFTYSSRDTTRIYRDFLYTVFQNAEYMINIPMLKGHKRAGATMFAKNHFGSHTRSDATHLHNGLMAPWEDTTLVYRKGYGLYRVQVDLMAHSLLGKKNLLYLMDALWATDYELDKPLKWQMAPFNNDWMSSIFVSFDPVACESVGYDFLRSEFTIARGASTVVQMEGTDDYLHQAADSSQWANGVQYDPDSTGTLFASLGTHEHWNNSADKQYTRNLGTGTGIELYKADNTVNVADKSINMPKQIILMQNYPNPFNPTTNIVLDISARSLILLQVYDIQGRLIQTLYAGMKDPGKHQVQWNANGCSAGMYFIRITGRAQNNISFEQSLKVLLIK